MGIVGSIIQPGYFRLYNGGQSDIAIGEFHRQTNARCLDHAIARSIARCRPSCDILAGIVDYVTWYFNVTTVIRAPGKVCPEVG